MAELLNAIHDILGGETSAITIRHLFYRLVGQNVIEKTERAYKSLCSHLSRWRKAGEVAWKAFSDSTRWHIKPTMFSGIADALRRTQETYRRDLWATQPHYVEVWVEKDAIAGVIDDVTSAFGVPLFVCRGFASLSSMYSASETFKEVQRDGKEVTIFHLGDYDPSGHAAADAIERTFRETFDCSVNFQRIAILPEHIDQFSLPTRPTKQSDSRARNWTGSECVELDSMPPSELRSLVENAITSLIDWYEWEQLKQVEREEQETLERTLAGFTASQNGENDDDFIPF
jgi:predicted acyl esterase